MSFIFKFFDVVEPHLFQLPSADGSVFGGVIVRDERQTDSAPFRQAAFGQQTEVGHDLFVGVTRIAAVDVGVHVLHVDNVTIYDFQHAFHMVRRHIQRRFYIDLPFPSAHFAEGPYEVCPQQRLSPTEGDAATRSQKVQLILAHSVVEHLRRVEGMGMIQRERLRVEAPLAAQRTKHEGHQRGDALAVGSGTQAREG